MINNPNISQRGFTLIEVLVSLFIFSIISIGATTALTQSLKTKEQLASVMDELSEINIARTIIKNDISAITLRASRDELGDKRPYSLFSDSTVLLSFTRRGLENPGGLEKRGDLERVNYVFEEGSLIRISYEHENPGQMPNTYRLVLLKNIEDIKIKGIKYENNSMIKVNNSDIRFSNIEIPLVRAIVLEVTDKNNDLTEHFFEFNL
ncbi:MAG: type II secretion system minor pseudopilin GspJ [Hellea sp.]|nr:type II secretion system minor pseudopilin GspJ [Hellea sp.]MDG2360812.1 type II secretion system minor pseudopilin GspJ [Hellea sp.]|tara:strand:- start:1607 stop:2227 length:621 start_codon:yes stop_codon:yes gene_type:complete